MFTKFPDTTTEYQDASTTHPQYPLEDPNIETMQRQSTSYGIFGQQPLTPEDTILGSKSSTYYTQTIYIDKADNRIMLFSSNLTGSVSKTVIGKGNGPEEHNVWEPDPGFIPYDVTTQQQLPTLKEGIFNQDIILDGASTGNSSVLIYIDEEGRRIRSSSSTPLPGSNQGTGSTTKLVIGEGRGPEGHNVWEPDPDFTPYEL